MENGVLCAEGTEAVNSFQSSLRPFLALVDLLVLMKRLHISIRTATVVSHETRNLPSRVNHNVADCPGL